jgi:hypothetical protein
VKNDYKNMQFIYEGLLGDYPGASNSRYAPDPRNSGLHTYPNQLDFNKGNTGQNAYSVAAAAGGAGRMEAEEDNITGNIATELIIDKLSSLLNKASKDEMHYAIYALGSLKEFILKNNKPT